MEAGESADSLAGKKKSGSTRRNLSFAILSLCGSCTKPFMALLGSQAAFGKVSDFSEYFGSMNMVCSLDTAVSCSTADSTWLTASNASISYL